MNYQTASAAQTIALGKKLAKTFKGGEVIALFGELGAGKTTLVKGIAAGLGIRKVITSPTFLLMRVYPLRPPAPTRRRRGERSAASPTRHEKIKTLVHLDCYRIKNAAEISALGLEEYLGRDDAAVVIEWPEKIKKLLPRQMMSITLQSKQATNRTITIRYA